MNDRPLVAIGYGTRPQVIKSARLRPALRQRWSTLAIDTGQHYDYELNALLYRQLDVPAPDVVLDVGSAPREEQLARIATRCRAVLVESMPDALVVIGDTNSTLGCARAAASLEIPVVHVEAGLRSHVDGMAEEMNRREVDHLAAILCAPSRQAMRWLDEEGLSSRARLTGDVARDVLAFALARGDVQTAAEWPLGPGDRHVFATLHRAELTDDDALLTQAIESLARLAWPVVLALHPRTRQRLTATGFDASQFPALHVMPPLGYVEALAAIRGASVVVTDSGGVQREAYWSGVPCVTLRRETEWVETVELGANRLVAPERASARLAASVEAALASPPTWNRDAYGTGSASDSIADAIATLPALASSALSS